MSATVQDPPFLENVLLGPEPKVIAIRIEPIAKRVRAFVGGVPVVDSSRVMMMFETARLGVYYFPIEDVRSDLLVATSRVVKSAAKGAATYYSIVVEGRTVENAAWRYLNPPAKYRDIANLVAFHWKLMDAWFEEDEEVFVHARDPYHRIDVLKSSREVRVVVGGQVVAATQRAQFLFETGLPVRYYIPQQDVRTDLLQPSETQTACAYKGTTGRYWQTTTADGTVCDIAWCYDTPTPEVGRIAGRIAFFNERVDAIYVDGKEMPKTRTGWSLAHTRPELPRLL